MKEKLISVVFLPAPDADIRNIKIFMENYQIKINKENYK